MTGALTVSLRVNNDLAAPQLLDLARAAESAGIDQLWVSNDLFLRSAPTLLGALATATSRIRLGIGIVNPYTQHPAEIAMLAATMQELTGGRFLLGLGAGAGEFLGWVGIEQPKPLTATREALRAIRALLEGDRPIDAAGAGDGWTSHAYLRMPPAPTPIYVGAMSPRMTEFAGAEADGALALMLPPEEFSTVRSRIRTGADAAGRDLTGFDLPACVWLALDTDRARGDRALARKIAYYGSAFSPYLLERVGLTRDDFTAIDAALAAGDEEGAADLVTPAMLAMGISGDPDSVVVRCGALLDAGADHLSFGPPLGDDPVAAVELLGDAVLPRLRERSAG